MQLVFSSAGKSWPIQLHGQAPRTCRALMSVLPFNTQLHTPKIAGSHIYWHAPFIEDVEGATDVLDTKAGAFLYWPVRQFLEITFAPLQAETAHVTVLGTVEADIEGIAELASHVKHTQGRHIITASLEASGKIAGEAVKNRSEESVFPHRALWQKMPEDIARLPLSRAIMHPIGPVFTAESQMRNLHELLWWLRERQGGEDEQFLRQSAALALNKAATILLNFCHLQETPDLLLRLKQRMTENLPLEGLLDEAILVAGRLSAWLDLLIPWHDLNEAFKKTDEERP